RTALLAGGAAAVVVVAVIVFLVLTNSSGSGQSGSDQVAQPPPSSAGQPSGNAPSSSPDVPTGPLGQTPPDGKISDYSAAGTFITDGFFADPGANWSRLTPAAQGVYGDQAAFQQYWAAHPIGKYEDARADSGGANADGSITMNLTIDGTRRGYRVISSGGQMLIDSDTRLDSGGTSNQ
ncbi:serine/threonine protein kinase, partial [Amycolatopsis jiangsuensis]